MLYGIQRHKTSAISLKSFLITIPENISEKLRDVMAVNMVWNGVNKVVEE